MMEENVDFDNGEQLDKTYKLLTREEIILVNENNPVWRRARIGLLVAFWAIWLGLLIALILVVVLHPKCPSKPTLQFWQSGVGYAIDPFAFQDSDNDFIGDLNGLSEKLSYIRSDLGAQFVILTALSQGYYTNQKNKIGYVSDSAAIDSALGTIDDFKNLIRKFHKENVKVIVPIDMGATIIVNNVEQPTLFQQLLDAVADGTQEGLPEKLKENIINSVKFWMDLDADGILLKGIPIQHNYKSTKNANVPTFNAWNSTQVLLKEIRDVLNSYSSTLSKIRALLVEPFIKTKSLEETQFGMYLTTTDGDSGAHLVYDQSLHQMSPAKLFLDTHKSTEEIKMAFPTGDIYRNRVFNPILLALSFLLKGTPVIYYGSEIGFTCQRGVAPRAIYPMGRTPVSNIHKDYTLPMPWDRSGVGFSNRDSIHTEFAKYVESCGLSDTVVSSIAAGRGSDTPFSLIQKLIKLKSEPSLLWGTYETKTILTRVVSKRLSLFVRRAPDFPVFAIAINDPQVESPGQDAGSVLDLSDLCSNMRVRLVYPSLSNIKEDDEIESSKIYIASDSVAAIYVFECM